MLLAYSQIVGRFFSYTIPGILAPLPWGTSCRELCFYVPGIIAPKKKAKAQ